MLLENFRYAESTFSRDRLFALLGLACDGNEADFEPDYNSPLEAVVLKFARVFVRQGRGMQLLSRAGLNDRSDRFPSWIPDWTVKRSGSLCDTSEDGIFFAASGSQHANIRCVANTDELLVEGYEVDVIENISTSSNVEHEWEKYFGEIDTMIDSLPVNLDQDSPEELKWKVPIAGATYPKTSSPGGVDLKASYAALRKYISGNQKSQGNGHTDFFGNDNACPTPDNSLREERASYMAALQETLHEWKFVITKRGYPGVVPKLTEVGDTVAIFTGGKVPFIVRKSVDRSGAFRLVGECYVHSMINGEGLFFPGVVKSESRFY
jgi:hypothetical protein